jgi:hypothetical protein
VPVRKVKGGWTFGRAVYKSKATAMRAYRAYLAKKKS